MNSPPSSDMNDGQRPSESRDTDQTTSTSSRISPLTDTDTNSDITQLDDSLPLVLAPQITARVPFASQLRHVSPRRDDFIQTYIHPALPQLLQSHPSQTSSDSNSTFPIRMSFNPYAQNFAGNSQLLFLPSSSSTGYTLADLPIVTEMESRLHPQKTYMPYMQLGLLEITDDLFAKICPFDLEGLACPHDNIFEWKWLEARWERRVCGGLRLCEFLHRLPPPPPPPFSFPQLFTHPSLISHTEPLSSGKHNNIVSLCHLRPPPSDLRPPPHSLLPANHGDHALYCHHIHSIQHTCSSLNRAYREMTCKSVLRGEVCKFGHDLQSARVGAYRTGLQGHREEAREKRVRPGTVWLNWKGRWCWARRSGVEAGIGEGDGGKAERGEGKESWGDQGWGD